ncbi:hypothetical protein [Streptomyces chromofuscus]|uniref:Uncharacterized protein n=1 Tax=Streptomyces chromofuscus TaxID=42881 RepID=A0A7M2T4X4_STRCW|nr:hypothetical protein [Streptomyces chromofuscus]QOV42943.1 hypothetical protein IPT68_24580 [Streptomyces chromofuscus]GGS92352.1 hypothetical protein GCM10010254_10330 [Streptomyces chromofuscus]
MVEMTVRRRVLGLVVAAGVFMVAGAVGWWSSRSGGLLVVAQVLYHPVLIGLLVVAALTAAVIVGVRNLLFRSLVFVAAVLIGLLAVPISLFASTGREETMDEAAPDRSDRHLVVEEGAAMIDSIWWVYVDEGSGLTKRRWHVGYFNGASSNVLDEASWVGPDRVRLVTRDEGGAEVHLVDLTPESGEPLRTLSRG